MRQPRPAIVVLIVSIGVIVATGLLLLITQLQADSEMTVESVGSRDLATLQAEADPGTTATTGPWMSPQALDQSLAQGTSVPVHITIPRLNVSTKVLQVGLDENNAMAIPADITKVGWYNLGVAPGAYQGSAVMSAHRDGTVQGRGVFYDLGALSVGDKVVVENALGEKLKYRVVGRESISKKSLPLEELFAIDGPPRLTLISCGGYYDKAHGGYQENVIVTAVRDYQTDPRT